MFACSKSRLHALSHSERDCSGEVECSGEGLIAEMLGGVFEFLGGVDDCLWEVWVIVGEGLFK